MQRGEIRWASLPPPLGSGPGYRRPVVVVQADTFTDSAIGTVTVVPLTSNLRLAAAPGNVRIPRRVSGLARASVVNVSQVLTVDRSVLTERAGRLPPGVVAQVDAGLRLALDL